MSIVEVQKRPQYESLIMSQVIRSQFPALARVHNGHPVAYFDGALPAASQPTFLPRFCSSSHFISGAK